MPVVIMRVLYVIDSMTKDGAESQFLRTLEGLSASEYEVFVVLSRAEGERISDLVNLPCVKEVSTLAGASRRVRLLEKAFALGGIVRSIKPDIVHSWLWYSNFVCGLSRRFGFWRAVPFVASQRGDYQARYGRFRLWFTEKFIYHTADILLTNSTRIQRRLCERYPGKQIFSIPNLLEFPVEAWQDRCRGDSSDRLIVSVGRFASEKGHRYLLEALCLLERQEIAWRCVFLGDGSLEAELRALAVQREISEWVDFPGFREDVFAVLLTADVFVLPSLHEGSPNALIEAMGLGMPCIASAVGGVVDLIEDGENGILVPPADPAALATALHRVLSARDLSVSLGRNARATVQREFDSAASMRTLESMYRRLCVLD